MATARDIMKTELVTVQEGTSLNEAIELLMTHRISGLPVVDAQNNLVGILTEKDTMKLLYEKPGTCNTVSDLMENRLRSFQQDTPLDQVCDCLMANHFRRVPILSGTKLVGLISRADLMPTILEAAAANSR